MFLFDLRNTAKFLRGLMHHKLTMYYQGRHTLFSALQACLDEGCEATGIPDLSVHTRVVVKDVVENGDEAWKKAIMLV